MSKQLKGFDAEKALRLLYTLWADQNGLEIAELKIVRKSEQEPKRPDDKPA